MKSFLLIALLISISTAIPLANEGSNGGLLSNCKNVMEENGLTSSFSRVTAHVLHSLTLQDIRHYFEPHASNDIKIPTINVDVSSDDPILFDVVDSPNTNEFNTIGMKVLDEVLSHMDDENYAIKGIATLEKLVHGLHMHEEWQEVSDAYKVLKKNPPTDEQFCHCVLDIKENGVLRMMRYIALKLREPTLMFGRSDSDWWTGYKYTWTGLLSNEEEGLPRLRTSANWNMWKKKTLENHAGLENKHYEAASFLYCAMK